MSVLMPRLDQEFANQLIDRIDPSAATMNVSSTRHITLPVSATYAPSGGAPATVNQLVSLCTQIETLASECGWPTPRTTGQGAMFDAKLSACLSTHPLLQTGDALRDDTWACIATCLLPHLVLWRFGMQHRRFRGGIRNAFQRLWVRGRIFDRGEDAGERRWELLDALSEDALVSISERPALYADRKLARSIAEGWLRYATRPNATGIEDVMRRVTLQLRLRNEITLLSILDQTELDGYIDEEFFRAERHNSVFDNSR